MKEVSSGKMESGKRNKGGGETVSQCFKCGKDIHANQEVHVLEENIYCQYLCMLEDLVDKADYNVTTIEDALGRA